ncbi:MAG: flagellin [Paracoccaceae bacterium]
MSSSVLTNTSAMIALQNLRTTNSSLESLNNQISTGLKVGNAKDNAAVFAISQTMKSDVKGFEGISESLSLGQTTISVGRQAAESVGELLIEMKGKIVAAQEDNVDRAKIQTDVDALKQQIESVVGSAQFNGKNIVDSYDETSILSSLDRSGTEVEAAEISFRGQNLTSDSGSFGTADAGAAIRIGTVDDAGAYNGAGTGATLSSDGNVATLRIATDLADGDTLTIEVGGETFQYTNNDFNGDGSAMAIADLEGVVAAGISNLGLEGVSAAASGTAGEITITSTNKFEAMEITGNSGASTTVQVDADGAISAGSVSDDFGTISTPGGADAEVGTLAARAETISFGDPSATPPAVAEGDSFRVSLGGAQYDYTAKEGDTLNDVAKGLKAVIDAGGEADIAVKVNESDDPSVSGPTLQIDNAGDDVTMTLVTGTGGDASGGLVGLDGIDVTSKEGAQKALENIETLIQTSIDSASAFGSVQGRVEIQQEFVGKLTDAFESGIGSLVDADLEEASARLKALQTQQQLGVQALSIANAAPQSLLSLFR